jgi:endonuclease YncB( thermonuclease family)
MMISRLLVTMVLVVSCGGGLVATGPTASAAEPVTVVRIIDGDSLVVETETGPLQVRITGVNTPDRGECHHREAGAYLEEALEGAAVAIVREGTDQYGRVLARVDAGGVDLALRLVRSGHGVAVADTRHPEDLVGAEEAAYRERQGMWDRATCGSGPPPQVDFDPEESVTDPPGPDGDALGSEVVFIANHGSRPVELGGWSLRDASSRHRFRFEPGTTIRPGERIGISSSSRGWTPGGTPVWSNDGDIALLVDDSGGVVARWRY